MHGDGPSRAFRDRLTYNAGVSLEPSTLLGGRYRIDRVLGRGGMGAVYEATRLDLDRRVAVKLLDEAVDAPQEALAATEREARALAKLAHPHIVQIIDFSRGDGGPPFFVMEFLAGESLDTRLRRAGKIVAGTAALVMVQVLSALAAAHAADILHRDVKPANVFLTPTAAGFDFVKLLDFGIAANLSHHAAVSVRGGALMGTPSYMAPEQIRGEKLGPRTDVWGAGICLYQMLAGALPFDGENLGALLTNICNFPPPPLGDVDPALAAIVQRAIAKDPLARFSSAEAMRAALAPFAAVGAVPSRDLGGSTEPASSEAGATMSNDAMPLAATVHDPSSAPDREAYASTAMSGPPIRETPIHETLASGSAHTFGGVASPPSGLGWLPIANGVVALAFIGAVGFTLAPRKEAPLAGSEKASAPLCGFARIQTWGEGLVALQVAGGTQGMLLAASTGLPKPTLRYATLGDIDAPFDEWAPSLYAQTIEPEERIFPCAAAGKQLFGGGVRERKTAKGEHWTTFARFPHPSGAGLFGPGGRMDAANIDLVDLDCAAVDDLTVFAGIGPYLGLEQDDVFLDVADTPRKEVRSEMIDFPTRIRIDASREGFGRLLIQNLHPEVGFVDVHTLQVETAPASDELVDPNEGDVAISGGRGRCGLGRSETAGARVAALRSRARRSRARGPRARRRVLAVAGPRRRGRRARLGRAHRGRRADPRRSGPDGPRCRARVDPRSRSGRTRGTSSSRPAVLDHGSPGSRTALPERRGWHAAGDTARVARRASGSSRAGSRRVCRSRAGPRGRYR